jgi:1-acyl-sn-glycerol-3-phosphate acyltransferase
LLRTVKPEGTGTLFPFSPSRHLEKLRKVVRGYFTLFHDAKFTGLENIPPEGPALFAANHESYYDPPLVAAGQNYPMKFLAWDALFEGPKWFAEFIRDGGAYPIDPHGEDPGGFKTCLKLLKEGERVLIFPEGGRGRNGELMPLKEGVARLAMRSGAAILPVRISGAGEAWGRGDFAPRPWFPISVHYCPPIYPRPAKTLEERHAESKRLMSELMIALLGEKPITEANAETDNHQGSVERAA